jgi:hypothetical protein
VVMPEAAPHCPVCNGPNTRAKPWAIYCSPKCSRRARYLRKQDQIKAKSQAWRAVNHDRDLATQAAYRERIRAETRRKETQQRKQAAIEARLLRPRCVVCSEPIRYGKPGVRRDARTCGSGNCRMSAYRWFGPMKPRKGKSSAA